MSFASRPCSSGCCCCRWRRSPTRSMQRRRAARGGARSRNPALLPEPRHRAAGLAPAPAAAAAAARARRARRRARPPAAHGRRAAARGDGDDGHRRLGLDARQRRRARPADRRRRGRPRRWPTSCPTTLRLGLVTFSDYAEQTVAADHRPRPGQRRARPAASPTAAPRWATRCARGIEARAHAGRRTATAAARGGCRRVIVLLSDGKNTSGNTRPARRRAPGQGAPHPDLHDRARHAERRGRAAPTRSASRQRDRGAAGHRRR